MNFTIKVFKFLTKVLEKRINFKIKILINVSKILYLCSLREIKTLNRIFKDILKLDENWNELEYLIMSNK
jgi:acetone carboxylase gamma subunit